MAYFYPGDDGRYGVWISSPLTAAPKRYLPEPFASKDLYNEPKVKFSPDGKQILLLMNGGRQREEAWFLPYPANPSQPPRMVLTNIRSAGGTPGFCWMPDSRHVVLSLAGAGDASEQLWLADTVSGEYHALTSGTASRSSAAVSPDGQRIIFREDTGSYDIVSVDLASAAVHPLIATERNELMPSWAANKQLLAYVTDRNGSQEIWLHAADNSDRPLVTARDFPGVTVQWLMGPALSPEGDRVVYTRVDAGTISNRLWITAVAGGSSVQLTNDRASAEYPGSWSLDGNWFAYVAFLDGKPNLMKVKTTGQATPGCDQSRRQPRQRRCAGLVSRGRLDPAGPEPLFRRRKDGSFPRRSRLPRLRFFPRRQARLRFAARWRSGGAFHRGDRFRSREGHRQRGQGKPPAQ